MAESSFNHISSSQHIMHICKHLSENSKASCDILFSGIEWDEFNVI